MSLLQIKGDLFFGHFIIFKFYPPRPSDESWKDCRGRGEEQEAFPSQERCCSDSHRFSSWMFGADEDVVPAVVLFLTTILRLVATSIVLS